MSGQWTLRKFKCIIQHNFHLEWLTVNKPNSPIPQHLSFYSNKHTTTGLSANIVNWFQMLDPHLKMFCRLILSDNRLVWISDWFDTFNFSEDRITTSWRTISWKATSGCQNKCPERAIISVSCLTAYLFIVLLIVRECLNKNKKWIKNVG